MPGNKYKDKENKEYYHNTYIIAWSLNKFFLQ